MMILENPYSHPLGQILMQYQEKLFFLILQKGNNMIKKVLFFVFQGKSLRKRTLTY